MLKAALVLAREGVAVFPVGNDKAPRTPRGFHDATTDPKTLRGWTWDGMIGAAIAEGEVVLDVDPRNGGAETIAMLVNVHASLPRTRRSRTKSGGHHYWFTIDPGLTLRGSLGPGVDVKRAGKGYVVVPPSPGYVWEIGGAKVPLPDWLIAELVVQERNDCDTASAPKFFQWEQGTAYGMAARKNAVERLNEAANGARNDELNRAAFALAQLEAGGELAREGAIAALVDVALFIGLEMWEIRNTIESGWTAGEQVPRQAPRRVA